MGKVVFNSYVVKKMFFELTDKYDVGKNYIINPNLKFNITVSEKALNLEVLIEIYNTEEKPTPFNIEILTEARFDIVEFEDVESMRISASEQFYPYIRNMVSTICLNANMSPYFMPYIDFRKPISQDKRGGSKSDIVIRPLDENI